MGLLVLIIIIVAIVYLVKKKNVKPTAPAQPVQTEAPANVTIETHHVAGVSFRENEIESLGIKNSNYTASRNELVKYGLTDQKIFEYAYKIKYVEIVPEPDNQYDPNAIKVIADGVHIGYIKKGSCAHVHNLLRANKIQSLGISIGGGNYRYISSAGEGAEKYIEENDKSHVFAELYIHVKDDNNAKA